MIRYSAHFTDKDFPRGKPSQVLIDRLELARAYYGKPIMISSGGRTTAQNRSVDGAKDSEHIIDPVTGEFEGCDIKCADSHARFELLPILFRYFHRVGIYDKHLHVGMSKTLPQDVCWIGVSK